MKYVCELNSKLQEMIKSDLIANGIEGEDLELAICSKLVDLKDVIDISKYMEV